MTKRTLTILLTLFIVIAVIASWPSWGPDLGKDDTTASGSKPSLSSFDATTTTTVEITGGDGKPRTLKRDGDTWTINDKQANAERVTTFWTTVDEATIGDLVGRNPDNHARMGVAGTTATTVTFTGDEGTLTLVLGQPPTNPGDVHVRAQDADDVFVLEGDLLTQLGQPVETWTSKPEPATSGESELAVPVPAQP